MSLQLGPEDLEMPLMPRPDQFIHAPGADASNPRLLDHRDQRFLNGLPRFQKAESAPAVTAWDLEVDVPSRVSRLRSR
jgi:hypothetical protein